MSQGATGYSGLQGPLGVTILGYTGSVGATGSGFVGPTGIQYMGPIGLTGPPTSTAAKVQGNATNVATGNNTISNWVTEKYDSTNSMVPASGIYTAPSSGYYLVCGAVSILNNVANTIEQLMVIKNNDVNANAEYLYERYSTGNPRYFPFSTIVQCSTNDTIQLRVFNGSGGNQSFIGTDRYTSFAVAKI
jgi:hypothetical protein